MFKRIVDVFSKEPALATSLIGAALPLAAAFGLHLTGEQVSCIGAFSAVVAAVITRASSVPTAKSDDLIKTAIAMPSHSTVDDVKTQTPSPGVSQ